MNEIRSSEYSLRWYWHKAMLGNSTFSVRFTVRTQIPAASSSLLLKQLFPMSRKLGYRKKSPAFIATELSSLMFLLIMLLEDIGR